MSRPAVKVWARTLLVALLLAGSALALREFRRTQDAADLPSAPAKKQDFLVLVKCRGELSAQRSVQLIAPRDVPDLQIIWLAPPGSMVKAGQTVIKFDPSKSQQDLKEKQAALRQAQASVDQQEAQSRNTAEQDKLDLAKAKYDVERARLEASKQAIVSVIEGQESAIDLGLAEEKLKVQQAATALHKASDSAKMASLVRLRDEAKNQVELTEKRLTLMEVTTPLEGVISYLANTSQGWMNSQPYKVGDHAVPGIALAEIPDMATLQMESKMEEVDRGRIKLDDTVLIHVDAFPENVISAKLTSISPLTEQSFNEWPPTRTFRAFALIEKPDSRLRPGMNAGADIVETKLPGAISIPAKALFTIKGKPSIYTKRNGQYVPVEVRVKARNPDEIAVEGIAPGTLVALAEPIQEKK